MKKSFLLPLVLFLAFPFVSKAQWTRTSADTTNIVNLNSGKVGIGTATPSNKLEISVGAANGGFNQGASIVSGNGSYTTGHGGMLQFQNEDAITAGIRGVRISGWASGLAFYTHNSTSGNTFGSTFLERMRIDNNGNVGIGTTTPTNKLSIYDNASGSNVFRIVKDGYYDEMALYNFSNTDYFRNDIGFRRGRGTAASPVATQNGDWLGALNFWGTNSGAAFSNPSASVIGEVDGTPGASYVPGKIVFQTSDGTAITADRMTIKNNGNVGIGTTTPGFRTEIYGGPQLTASLKDAGSRDAILALNGNLGNVGSGGAITFGNAQSNAAGSLGFAAIKGLLLNGGGNVTGHIAFATRNATSADSLMERMRITSSGKVGIGTLSPDQLLTVNGTIHSTEVLVDLGVPAPDYVFKKNYKLKPLSKVLRYIDLNKHLPEIPSAKVMEKDGVNLSEMNMKLLKKVEELTLYLIAESKKNESQQKEIDDLKRHQGRSAGKSSKK